MNDPSTVDVRPGPVRSGSAVGRMPPLVDAPEPDSPAGPTTNRVDEVADRTEKTRLFDWVPTGEPGTARGANYPIEGGVPHPHWVREPAQHRLAAHPIVVDDSTAVVRLLIALAVIAFLLGLIVFYPVSPLGR